MSSVERVSEALNSYEAEGLGKFMPEPETRLGKTFSSVMKGVMGAANGILGGVADIDGNYENLLSMQLQMQEQMQRVSLLSNIYKSEHETQMAAIRNIRVS